VRRAKTLIVTGRALVFLDMGTEPWGRPVLATVGDEAVLIPDMRFPLGELPWPPDPTKGIVIRGICRECRAHRAP
jgi:hypothetical protein